MDHSPEPPPHVAAPRPADGVSPAHGNGEPHPPAAHDGAGSPPPAVRSLDGASEPPVRPVPGLHHAVPGGGNRPGGNGSAGKRSVTAAEALATELHREIALREELERRLADAESQLAVSEAQLIRAREVPTPAPGAPEGLAAEAARCEELARRLAETETRLMETETRCREAEEHLGEADGRLGEAGDRLGAQEARLRDAETHRRDAALQLRERESQLLDAETLLHETVTRLQEAEARLAQHDQRQAQSEQRHTQQEQRLAYLMSSSPLGFFDDDAALGTTYYSAGCLDMLGYRPDEMLLDRAKFLELLHPEDRNNGWMTERAPVTEGMNRFTQQFRLRHQDGSYRWIESTGMELKDPAGKHLRAMGFYRDVTGQKALEERLHQSEERFGLLVTSSPLGFFDTDVLTGKSYYSPLWKSMLGYRPEELPDVHETWLGVIHPEDKAGVVAAHTQRNYGESRRPFSHALRVRHKDGYYRWVQASGIDFFAPDGRLLRALGFHADIHALKTAEEALAHEKEFLGVTLDSISDGVITTNAEGHVIYLNAAAETLCGLSTEEADGLPVEEFYRRAGAQVRRQADNPVRAVLASGMRAAPHDPAHLSSPGRPEKVIADNAAPILEPSGKMAGAVLVFHDITDRHRAAEELQKAGRIESLGVLAGGIAHDFNNLLTSILGNLSVARSGGELPIRAIDSLGRAEKACWRARDLTGQLLTFAKGGDPVRVSLELPPLIEQAVRSATSGSGVQLAFQFAPDLPQVEADQGQIVQVIHNLAVNAAQAMPGGGKLHVSMDVVHSPQGLAAIEEVHQPASAYIEVKVRDTGTGIAPEHLSKIFDPFFSTRTNGTGLGLAIAYSIVRKHDGVIRVDSRPGGGSTFTIYLPVSPSAPPPLTPEPAVLDERRTGGRVLFMDDDPDIRDLAGAILDLIGYEPTLTGEGSETLTEYQAAKAAGRPYAAVILDLTIPGGMGGKETIRRLREIDPDVRAIVSSGYSNDAVIADFRAHGFMAMVAKPYRMDDLARVLTTAITGEGLLPLAVVDEPTI